jgi:hypothetical protein
MGVAAVVLATAAAAQAASIVYIKGGNVWLSTPDGAQGYQVTFDGGWDSPSEADDGTIMAVRAGQTYRLSPSGQPLGAPVPTVFHGADPTTSHGPFGARISPDGTKQTYWGDIYTSYEDFSCGCTLFRWEAFTRWGASDQFNEPNQTRGQELYGEPAWINNSLLLLSDIGSVFGKQVAVYSVGDGDNTLTQWFSDPDPSVKQLQFGAVTRAGDKLAFVATTQNPQDQIRLYETNGAIPNAPTPVCALAGADGGQFSYPSFSPDGSELAWQDAGGVHLSPVSNLSDCSTITDQLIIPGGSEPDFGPANVNMANAPAQRGTMPVPVPAGTPTSGPAAAPGGSALTTAPPAKRHHRRHRHRRHHRHHHGHRVRAADIAR